MCSSVMRTALLTGLCLTALSQWQPLAIGEELQVVPLELRRYFDAGMFVDLNRGFIFSRGSPSALLATDDGGVTWRLVLDSPEDDGKGAPFFLDAQRFWFFTDKDEIYRTTDGGRTFDVYKPRFADPKGRGEEDVCGSLFFRTEEEAWAPCSDSVQKSTDGGRTWRIVRVLKGATLSHIWMFDAREGVTVSRGGEGGILRTDDGGITWKRVSDRNGQLGCTRDGFCVIWVSVPGWVLASSDRGRTWQDLHIPLQGDGRDMLSRVELVHSRLIVAVGIDLGATDSEMDRIETWNEGTRHEPARGFILTWDGANWIRINHTDPQKFSGVHFLDESHGWLFANGRVKEEPTRIFKTSDGGRTLEFVPDYFRQIAARTPSPTPLVFPTPSPIP
jgi:photosystem II stability/assembly factor-like uncharacterized protein